VSGAEAGEPAVIPPELQSEVLTRLKGLVHGPGEPSAILAEALRLAARYHWAELADACFHRWGPVVQSGPFAGMVYPFQTGCIMPRLLGAYEAELHDALALLARRPFHTILNIGCGEGYYAVGLARLFPTARVVAYETDAAFRRQCREMAQLNGVADRLQIEGTCRVEHLGERIEPPCLVFCDCEGAEAELIDPAAVPPLADCHLIVEAHDFLRPGLSELIGQRFVATHAVRVVPHGPRDPFAYPKLQGLSDFDRFLALAEDRSGTTPWVVMIPRTDPLAAASF
jgi:hypothetical protein